MIHYGFVKVIFVSAVVAVSLQCAVYPIRHLFGMAVAWRVLRASLYGFLGIAVACLVWGASTGELPEGLADGGWNDLVGIGLFIGFTMFISYFMGSRYLADELERARQSEVASAEGARNTERGSED